VSIATDPNEGLSNTQRRTRAALVAAARDLVAQGVTPTVEEAAVRAAVSRTTAYRYFPNRTALLVAAHPEVAAQSLLSESPATDPVERLGDAIDRFVDLVLDTEVQQRTMLRVSLDPDTDDAARRALPLRQGRAIGWFVEALEPLRERMSEAEIHRLALAIRSAVGIEALVWLRDVAGLSREEAARLMRWSARSLLHAAMSAGPPPVEPG
jgi:AcrR family transcriptional regulator